MRYFVKIDVRSIKKNKSNSPFERVYIGWEASFVCKQKPDILNDESKFCIRSWHSDGSCEGIIYSQEALNELMEVGKKDYKYGIRITQENKFATIKSLPNSPYSYKYIDKKIKCDYCKRSFKSSELILDSSIWGNDIYSEKVCPFCRTWDCCNIEYETIDEALKRKNI